jgi:hypothetical protein
MNMTITDIRKALRVRFLKATYSAKRKGFIFKKGYFYRIGIGTPKDLAEAMRASMQTFFDENCIKATAKVIDYRDNYNAWPKDSYFEACIGFTMNEEVKQTT